MERETKQFRSVMKNPEIREENNELHIAGYFAVFNKNYEMFDGASESIAQGAFTNSLQNDVRALINHDDTLVIGRTTAGTLSIREDDFGLWGDVIINPKDTDAMNIYARVQRGDVNQCSIGFFITSEETEFREDGSVHWTIKDVDLFEVSVCTFPAYTDTSVQARKHDLEELKAKRLEAMKVRTLAKLKGEQKC